MQWKYNKNDWLALPLGLNGLSSLTDPTVLEFGILFHLYRLFSTVTQQQQTFTFSCHIYATLAKPRTILSSVFPGEFEKKANTVGEKERKRDTKATHNETTLDENLINNYRGSYSRNNKQQQQSNYRTVKV